VAKLVQGRIQSGNDRVDVVNGNGKLLEVKTSLLAEARMSVLSYRRPGVGAGVTCTERARRLKGADRLILVASQHLIHGRGPLLQRPGFYDLDYEQVIDALKHAEEQISLAMLGGWNDWSGILPAFRRKAEDLTRCYGLASQAS
jgi:hypothetical protein